MAEPTEDPESLFEITAETEATRIDRYQRLFDVAVLAPLRILWSDWRARVGLMILAAYVIMGTVGVVLLSPPTTNQASRLLLAFENWRYPLGSDSLGQPIFRLIVHSTPVMFKMAFGGATFATLLATSTGMLGGYAGGNVDRVIMLVTDMLMALPGLPLLIVIAAVFQPTNPFVIGIILTANHWAGLARSIRSQVLTVRETEYVEASRAMGVGTQRILSNDILPNIMPYVLINFVNTVRVVIFSSVALYFLGVLPFTNLNWGVILNLAYREGGIYSLRTAHWLLAPLITIVIISLGLILIAQSADRLFNPRVRARHSSVISEAEEEDESETGGANVPGI